MSAPLRLVRGGLPTDARRVALASTGTYPLASGELRTCPGCGAHLLDLPGAEGAACPRCEELLRSPEARREEREQIEHDFAAAHAALRLAEARRVRLERLERGGRT